MHRAGPPLRHIRARKTIVLAQFVGLDHVSEDKDVPSSVYEWGVLEVTMETGGYIVVI
jgi:hypothetical protein